MIRFLRPFLFLILLLAGGVGMPFKGVRAQIFVPFLQFDSLVHLRASQSGFRVLKCEELPNSLTAVVADSNNILFQLQIEPINNIKPLPGKADTLWLNNQNALFLKTLHISYLRITNSENAFCATVSANAALTPDGLAVVLNRLGVEQLRAGYDQWPSEIPEHLRLQKQPLRVRMKETSTEGYQSEVQVLVMFDQNLQHHLCELFSSNEQASDDFIDTPEILLLCRTVPLRAMTKQMPDNKPVELIFFVKKTEE